MASSYAQGKNHYRSDIDGLRAVAVLAVVLFHIGLDLIPGGFAGVDIFFVISGFLITGNIIRETNSEKGFSFAEFYRRRALRILPVLFTVLLVTLLVSQFVLLPDDLKELSYASIASVASAANIYFTYFLNTSYFSQASLQQPLLHLWSLGVEEQFYFIWPIVLIALVSGFRYGSVLVVVVALAMGSFALAESLLATQPKFAYYMLPTRAGELLIGALLAIMLSRDGSKGLSRKSRNVIGLLGAGLIVFSLGWITEDTGFPGINALPSTIGAALVIWSGSGRFGWMGRFLSLKPLVFIGLISYSLYLWHWPVLAFYRYAYGAIEPMAAVGLFVLMLALSVLSYRMVERPCRRLKWSFRKVAVQGVTSGAFAVVGLCVGIVLSRGFGLYAWDDEYREALQTIKPAPAALSYPYVCQSWRLTRDILNRASCIIDPSGSQEAPKALLWGDSHAAHYVGVLGAFSESGGYSFRNAAHSSCPPLFGGAESVVSPSRQKDCLESIRAVRDHLHLYTTVVMGGAWSSYSSKNPDFLADLEGTIDVLVGDGKAVIILGQVPSFRNVDRKCEQKSLKRLVRQCGSEEAVASRPSAPPTINYALQELAGKWATVSYFDVSSVICPQGACASSIDDRLVYYDSAHLSMDGSWLVGRRLVREVGTPSMFLASVTP